MLSVVESREVVVIVINIVVVFVNIICTVIFSQACRKPTSSTSAACCRLHSTDTDRRRRWSVGHSTPSIVIVIICNHLDLACFGLDNFLQSVFTVVSQLFVVLYLYRCFFAADTYDIIVLCSDGSDVLPVGRLVVADTPAGQFGLMTTCVLNASFCIH